MRCRVFASERRGGSGSEYRPFISIPQYAWLFIDLAGLVRGALASTRARLFASGETFIYSFLAGFQMHSETSGLVPKSGARTSNNVCSILACALEDDEPIRRTIALQAWSGASFLALVRICKEFVLTC
jgi:hypothetical protein